MTRQRVVAVAACAALLAGWTAARAETTQAGPPSARPAGLLGGRLAIGLRLSGWSLEDSRRYLDGRLDNRNRRGNFLGSLWGLDVAQTPVPSPFVECRVLSGFGIGAAYDQVRIRTLDWADNDAQTTPAGDGDLRLRGAQVYVLGALRNPTRVTPLARVGHGWYSSAFFETGGWALPGRSILVEDTRGWFVDFTLRVALRGTLRAEASYEHLWLHDVPVRAGGASGAFPARGDVVRIGLGYGF